MDSGTLTLWSLWIHLPLVTAWIGLVMFDVFAMLAPGFSAEQRGRMIAWSRPFVIVAIVVIMTTGIIQTVNNPLGPEVTSWATLQELKGKTYGYLLFWKHGFVLATFVLTIVARFLLAPRMLNAVAGRADGGGMSVSLPVERSLLWVSALNLCACLGALALATRMIWELH